MDYFAGVVADYLQRNRTLFVNAEFALTLDPKNLAKGNHWYIDFAVMDHPHRTVFLGEVSYAGGLGALTRRLRDWSSHWPAITAAVQGIVSLDQDWSVRPWLFVPEKEVKALIPNLRKLPPEMKPVVSTLEMTLPWTYKWDSIGEERPRKEKSGIPEEYFGPW
jgi:hypothetical protein